jgi:dihydrofolate reductase
VRNLIYTMTVSLDGYVADPDGGLDWSVPDDELFRFHTEQTAELGLYVCGRRLYEAMLYWETADQDPSLAELQREFAGIWTSLPKIVASTTLEDAQGNYRVVRDDIVSEVAALKRQPGKDIAAGGASLAATLISAGLVDELRLLVSPVVLGGGTPYFPRLERPITTELIDTRTFGGRVVLLRHRVVH